MINRIDDMYEITDGYQFMGSVKLQDCEGELYFCVGDALESGYYELLIETDKYTLKYIMGFDDEEKAQITFDLDIGFIECIPSVDELIEYGFKCTFNYGEPITDNNNGFKISKFMFINQIGISLVLIGTLCSKWLFITLVIIAWIIFFINYITYKKLIIMVEIYDVETEIKYRKLYDQKLRDIMVGYKVTQDNRIEAALEVYDGKTFMNTYGIKYEIKVNKDAKYSNEVLIVRASRNGKSDVQSLDPSLVSLYLG